MSEAKPLPSLEAEMLVYVGDENTAKYSVTQGEYVIGRDKTCPVFIDAEGVSRHHARLTFVGYELIIEDLGSANGVFIEGVQIQLPTRVRPDQQVEIGQARLYIRLKAESSEMLEAALWDPDLGLAPIRGMLESKKYKVMGSIGRGGMGIVHMARDLRFRRTVAMKVIKTSSQFSRENVLRFVDEAQLTGQLQHPNIVPVYELGLDDHGEVFYTMKFVKGTTLDQVLRRIQNGDEEAVKKFRLANLLTVFQKVCDGVAYAHSMGVVHRDLKPDNIMVGEYGEVLVMDWGLAKKVASGIHEEHLGEKPAKMPPRELRGFETLHGLIVGTPPYISPEAARGELDQIDARSDIYVLGEILYAMLTLRPPFPGTEFGELIESIVSGQFVHPTSYSQPVKAPRSAEPAKHGAEATSYVLAHLPNRRVPDGLAAIVVKAMAAAQEDRYQTVAELQAEVLAWQGGFAPKAERAGLARQIILWAGRHKTNVALFAFFFILINVLLVVNVASIARERDRAKASERTTKASEEQLSQALKELRGVAPFLATEAQDLIAEKKLEAALSRIDAAIRQLPNDAGYHSLRGNILQTLLRWDEAVEAYEEALALNPKLTVARENLDLTNQLIAATPEESEPAATELKALEASLLKQKRLAEASTLIERFAPGKPLALKALRAAVDADPQLKGIRDWLQNQKLRGRFQPLADGTYSAHLRGIPLAAVGPLLKTQLVTISTVYLDEVNIQDLSVLQGLPLRSLSLSGCVGVSDLTPLTGLPLQVLNLSRTAVRDLTPLSGMPLTELNLEGCVGIVNFLPLKECPKLEKLFLPRQARNIDFLRDMPSLKFIGFKSMSQPAEEFWAEFGGKKGLPRRDGLLPPKAGPRPGLPPLATPPAKADIPPTPEPPTATGVVPKADN